MYGFALAIFATSDAANGIALAFFFVMALLSLSAGARGALSIREQTRPIERRIRSRSRTACGGHTSRRAAVRRDAGRRCERRLQHLDDL